MDPQNKNEINTVRQDLHHGLTGYPFQVARNVVAAAAKLTQTIQTANSFGSAAYCSGSMTPLDIVLETSAC